MSCRHNSVINLTEMVNITHSINPCTNPGKDSFIMEVDNNVGSGLILNRANKLVKLKGCCSSLSPILQLDNLKMIMDVMRLSIGITIPRSSRYSNLSSSNVLKMLDKLFSLDKLAMQLKKR